MPTTVYGYIRLEGDDEAEVDRLHDQLTAHATAEGWHLADVFVDRTMPSARIVRPGLTRLLEAVRATDDCAVLVADYSQFSTLPAARRAIEEELTKADCLVVSIAASAGQTHPAAS